MRAAIVLAFVLHAFVSIAAVPRRAICWPGDSITLGYYQNPIPAPVRLSTSLGKPVANLGVGGDLISPIYARWQQFCQPFPYRVTVAEGCTNNLAASMSGSACWSYMQTWIEAAQAAGQVVVLVLVPPRWGSSGWTSDMEAERLTFNQDARDYVAAHPSVLLFDSDARLGTGTPKALQASYDYGDHLHLSDAGNQALADGVAALLQ